MSPFRLLLLAGLVWLVIKVLRSWGEPPRAVRPDDASFEPTSRCPSCNTLVPSRGLGADGRCGTCARRQRTSR